MHAIRSVHLIFLGLVKSTITKLLIMQFSPSCSYFLSPSSQYSPHYPVLNTINLNILNTSEQNLERSKTLKFKSTNQSLTTHINY
jgi:hypothetical protein